jgi:tetratricopeptide (TPR) repeat protein
MPRKGPVPGYQRPIEQQAGKPAAPPTTGPNPHGRLPLLIGIALVAAVFMDYGQLCGNDAEWFRADDSEYIVQNKNVYEGLTQENVWWGLTRYHSANWHPLTWWSLQLDSDLWGKHKPDGSIMMTADGKPELNPGGFHFTNALLHAVAGVLLMWTLTRMTGAFWRSALVAALFTLHPLRVESVAWATERKDVLGSLFWILTMLAYDWYVRQPSLWRYVLVAVGFALGLLAKPLLVTLPCALLLLDYWPLRRADLDWRKWKWLFIEKLPLFALSAGACVLTVMAQGVADPEATPMYEAKPLGLRVLGAGRAYVLYVWKTIWPTGLAPLYTEPNSLFPTGWAATACVIVILVTIAVILVARSRPYLAVGWFWYLGTLVPMIGFVAIGIHTICDRYTYIPHIGLFLMLVWGISDALTGRVPRLLPAVAAVAAVIACCIVTYFQARLWRDNVALLEHAVRTNENNFGGYDFLGVALMAKHRTAEALPQFRRAIEIEPKFPAAHFHLGKALAQTNDFEGAAKSYEDTLAIVPNWILPKVELGLCFMQLRRMEEARPLLAEAVAFAPDKVELHFNYGIALLYRGEYEEAEREAREVLRVDPGFQPARRLAGQALLVRGKVAEAEEQFHTGLWLAQFQPDPTAAHYLGYARHMQGHEPGALDVMRRCRESFPTWPGLERGDAWKLATDPDAKRRNGSLALLKARVASYAVGENDPMMLDTLAAAQAEVGEFSAAVSTLDKARPLAEKSGDAELVKAMTARRQLYEKHQPYRE